MAGHAKQGVSCEADIGNLLNQWGMGILCYWLSILEVMMAYMRVFGYGNPLSISKSVYVG